MNNLKWKTLIALAMIYIAIFFNQMWLIGLLFLFWTFESLKNRRAYIIEDIKREENPILYWIIVVTWFLVALLYFDFTKDFLLNLLC